MCFRRRFTIDISDAPTYSTMDEPIKNAPYIPLRLTHKQRQYQRLMRGIMLSSSYTDKVDTNIPKRDVVMMKEIQNVFNGFLLGVNIKYAKQITDEMCFISFQRELQACIEYSRRFKIMNPDLLRTEYVRFLYILQDANRIKDTLGFSVVSPVLSVGNYCKGLGIEELLQDEALPLAITPVPNFKDKKLLNKALRKKDVIVNELCETIIKKSGYKVSKDDVEIAIRSLNDANNFANDNTDSAVKLTELLQRYFKPTEFTEETNLAIVEGIHGSRLTHKHEMQYIYVLQSLTLWKNICKEMFSLWMIAESDLLNPDNPYELRETGQSLQRVQAAPNLYKAVLKILEATRKELGSWVGLDSIHLGDNQVPNAFFFIDKYGQISRILVPILRTLDNIDYLVQDKDFKHYLDSVWGSAEKTKVAILRDFFRHGFDGSGGDNLEDAGSCIDGRLTSAWNWCSSIRNKTFYPLFLMAGFTSFDGDLSI